MKNLLVICKNAGVQDIINKITGRNKDILNPDYYTSPEEAQKQVLKRDYEIIISEYTIHEIGGKGFLKSIQDSGKDIPVIFLTNTEEDYTNTDAITGKLNIVLIDGRNTREMNKQLDRTISNFLLKTEGTQEKELNEAKYKSVIESMDDSIYMVDRECRYLFMNKKHLERIGRSTEFFKDRRYEDFHTPEESGKFSENINRLFSTGEDIEEEYEKNGKRYQRTFTPVRDINDEKVVAANIISREISGDNKAPGRENSIYIVDQDCRYLSINNRHMERLGINCEDLFIGRNYDEFHHKGKNEKFSSMVEEVFSTGEILRDEYESGKLHFTRRFCPVMDILTNNVVAVTIVSTNITDQKMTEKSLIEANKKLNLLNSITRHDILNQMTVLLGYLDLSISDCRDENQKNFLEKQKIAADTIYHQISFTRDYQEIGVHTPAWQDVSCLIDRASKALSHGDIKIENSCGGLKIFADPLLEKVFYNLIDNSVRHGGKISKISFYSSKMPHGIRLICEDDGTGIRDEDKEIIFKRGYGKNTGLGLFLIKEILSITGLEIHETGRYGEGARFEIIIPDMMYSQ